MHTAITNTTITSSSSLHSLTRTHYSLSLSHYSLLSLFLLSQQFKETRGNMKSLYPTATYKWFMINIKPSYAGKVQGAISSFGGRSAYKMIVCDTNYKAVLEAEVDKSMLPSQFGGNLPASCFPTG